MDITINNEEVERKIQELIEDALPEAIETGITKACLVIEKEAKKKCPVDDGQLRNSITHKVDKLEGQVGTNVEYAPYVEIGTGIYSTKGSGRMTPWVYRDAEGKFHKTKGMKAQPFLKPAVDNNKDKILESFKGVLEE